MRITTMYVPTDADGQPFDLRANLYTLSDLKALAVSLARAGVTEDDALAFSLSLDGRLTVIAEKSV